MTAVEFSLPPGFAKLTGACSLEDGIFCWAESRAAVWSTDGEWLVLPDAPADIEGAQVTGEGLAVLCDDNQHLGFWVYGGVDWSWWERFGKQDHVFEQVWADDLIVVSSTDFTASSIRLHRASASAFEKLAEVDASELGSVICAGFKSSGDDLILALTDGLYRWQRPFDSSGPVRARKIDIQPPGVPDLRVAAEGAVYLLRPYALSWKIDLGTGAIERIPLGYASGCGCLWRAFAADDHARIKLLLDAIDAMPELPDVFESQVFDFLIMDEITAVGATTEGIVTVAIGWKCPECGINNLGKDKTCDGCGHCMQGETADGGNSGLSFLFSATKALTWELLLEPGETLPRALDLLLEPFQSDSELLVEAIVGVAGDEACAKLVEWAQGKNFGGLLTPAFDGVKDLFGRIGVRAADVCREALESDDDAVLAVACAAAGAIDGEDQKPLLWDDQHPIPADRLTALVTHSSKPVRMIAASTCGVLAIKQSQQHLGAMLAIDEDSARITAAEALGRMTELDDTWNQKLSELALKDSDDQVREAAIEALGKQLRGQETLDVLIRGLGDLNFLPRSSAAGIIGKQGAILSYDQYLTCLDALSLLSMAGALAEDETDYTLGLGDILSGPTYTLTENFDEPEELQQMPKNKRMIILAACALGPALARITDEVDLDESDYSDLVSVFEALDRSEIFDESDAAAISDRPKSAASLLAMINRLRLTEPEIAARLAILVNFVLRNQPLAHQINVPASGYVPLHQRLQAANSTSSPDQKCHEVVKQQAAKQGIAGLSALFSLAARADDVARLELERRILGAKFDGWNVLISAYQQLLDGPGRIHFIGHLIAAEKIPLPLRRWAAEEWDEDEQGKLPPAAKRSLLESVLANAEVPFDERRTAAQDLADLGDLTSLERLWSERQEQGLVTDDELYEFSRDMCRSGHAEYLDNVRGEWIERGDLGALPALAACGTAEDIAELEKALELKAPEHMIRETMAAIRARCGES